MTLPESSVLVSNMQRTTQLGTEFWNDSCDLHELSEAVQEGAVGATSNPVIVCQVVENDRATWTPVLDALIQEHPTATEDDIAWLLTARMAQSAAALLRPVYDQTEGRKGYLSLQVNPKLYRDTERMLQHARDLVRVAPNIAIKIPATAAGVAAIECLTAEGIRVNATVCFSLPQAIACAEAVERGVERAVAAGCNTTTLLPNVTLMVGRLDDHLRRVMDARQITVDPGHLNWAGIAIFKKAYGVFQARKFRSTLLAAAYRCSMHWTELVGPNVSETMPYKWWKQFNASALVPRVAIHEPVQPEIMRSLHAFEDFRQAAELAGMTPTAFARFGPSIHTLQQFLAGYQDLLRLVRERMLRG